MKIVLTRGQACAVACVLVAATGLAIVGYQHVLPPLQPKMLSGSTWLASRSVGELTLVDGISAAVSASVPVAQPNVPFTVAIGDQRAYTVDSTSGNVVGISGATLEKAPMKPLTSQVKAMTVHPVGDAYVAVDSKNGLLQAMGTGAEPLGEQERLPESVLDVAADGRRVWLADGISGGLLSFEWTADGPIRRELRDVHGRDAKDVRILITDDQPVVVDRTHQTATLLTASGEIDSTATLTLGETTQVSASARAGRVLVVEPSRGVVMSCEVRTGTCGLSFPVAAPNADLGAAVEARGHAFVPDNATNRVHVVDLVDGSAATTEALLGEGVPVELSTRDGVVFFNDPNSEKAGVIDSDGRVRRIDKYDPTKPPTASSSLSSPPSRTTTTTTVPSGATSGARPSLTGSRGNRPDGTTGSLPLPTGSSSNSPDMPHINGITASPENPEAGEEVSFTADLAGAIPERWEWEVRGPRGEIKTTASTPRMSYRFDAAAAYEVKLTISAGSRRDEETRNLVVMAAIPSAECGDTITQNVRLRKDLVCTGNALTVGANDVVIDLNGHSITGSGSGTAVWIERWVNVTVRNGTIRAFELGVLFNYSEDSEAEQIRFESITNADFVCNAGRNLTLRDSFVSKEVACKFGSEGLKILGSTITGARLFFHSVMTNTLIADCTFTDSEISLNKDVNVTTIVDSELTRTKVSTSQANGLNVSRSRVYSSPIEVGVHSTGAVFRDNEIVGADVGINSKSPRGGEFMTFERNTFRDNGIGLNIGNPIEMPLSALKDLVVAGNKFINNGVAGVFMDTDTGGPGPHLTFDDNTFISNGHRPTGLTDREGRPVNDGLHIHSQAGSDIVVRNNKTQNNADHGIEAVPGAVVDGGGNTSAGNPAGCLGVAC